MALLDDIGGVNFPALSASSEMTPQDIDQLIQMRQGDARSILRMSSDEALRLSRLGRQEATQPLEQFAGLDAFNEQQALLGTLGAGAQEAAIGGIPVSQFDQELQSRQQQRLLRGAGAAGELGSGATIASGQQLAGGQMAAQIQKRLGQLEPLVATARGVRSTLSGIDEASSARQAQLRTAQGTDLANLALGAGASGASSLLQRAELSGLQGIGAANQRSQQANQLAQLAGTFAPQITSFAQSFGSQPTANLQVGANAFIPEAGNFGVA